MWSRRYSAAIALTAMLVALAGCAAQSTNTSRSSLAPTTATVVPPSPTTGKSIADHVYAAARLHVGEVMVIMVAETEPQSATTRVLRAAGTTPEWRTELKSGGRRSDGSWSFPFTFTDGSRLVLVSRPTSSHAGSTDATLMNVEIFPGPGGGTTGK
jgi:hypothetical protein